MIINQKCFRQISGYPLISSPQLRELTEHSHSYWNTILRGAGGVNVLTLRRFTLRCPLTLVLGGNGSIGNGIDLHGKQNSLKKYFRIFENELIKVEKSWKFRWFSTNDWPLRLALQWLKHVTVMSQGSPSYHSQEHVFRRTREISRSYWISKKNLVQKVLLEKLILKIQKKHFLEYVENFHKKCVFFSEIFKIKKNNILEYVENFHKKCDFFSEISKIKNIPF